jgi:hypothetical protein
VRRALQHHAIAVDVTEGEGLRGGRGRHAEGEESTDHY